MNNNYKYFSLTKHTTDDDLKKQYRELSKKYHPDKENGSEQQFTEMTNEYEEILKKRLNKFGNFNTGKIRERIYAELNEFYTKIAPELTEYKPEFLQLYDDIEKISFKAIDEGIASLSKKLKLPPALSLIFKKYAKATVRKKSKEYRKKIENI
jgi:curved DNA-binding protein CbpA